MERTKFAGLTELEIGESTVVDGGSFTGRNIVTIDQYLSRIVTHQHNGASALPNPTQAPTLVAHSTGGTIPPGTPLYASYTLLDGLGGETTMAPVVTATIPAGIGSPTSAASGTVNYASGSLQVGLYQYVYTLTDGQGGESRQSQAVTIDRQPGHATACAVITGLTQILAASFGATGWRLYRSTNGAPYSFIGSGNNDQFIDTGLIPLVIGTSPPLTDTTGLSGSFTLTVSASALNYPKASGGFNVYISSTPNFYDPCLQGTYALTSGSVITVGSLAVLDGSPPPVSTAVQGSNPITQNWLGPVASPSLLGAGSRGDVRLALSNGSIYAVLGAQAAASADWTNTDAIPATGSLDPRVLASFPGVIGVALGSAAGSAASAAVAFYLPPFYEPVAGGVTKQIVQAVYSIRASGSVNFDVRQNGVAIPSLSGLVATSTIGSTVPNVVVSVSDLDRFSANVRSITGVPDGFQCDLFVLTASK